MAQSRAVRVVESNGHTNGAVQLEEAPAPSEARKVITLLSLFGSQQDAKMLYFAQPGTGIEGWAYLERVMEPVRRYVIDGDAPYVVPLVVPTEYQGVRTPPGDCQGDALPEELKNHERELVKAGIQSQEGENP